MILITSKQLEADIRELPKDYNKGRSLTMIAIGKANEAANRRNARQSRISRMRAKIIKENNHKVINTFKQVQNDKVFSGKNVILTDYSRNLKKLNESI